MHQPVLVGEVLELLRVKRGGAVIDGTVGGGGHALALLERIGAEGRLLGIDRDAEAIERVRARLAERGFKPALAQGNFADVAAIARRAGFDRVDGVLFDCGVSSEQLDAPERGFSFTQDGPLDMRMDRSGGVTAADLVNGLPEEELGELLRTLGEEPAARRIARAVARARAEARIETTGRLARVVEQTVGGRRGRRHPATRTFQALRIRVNGELDALEQGLCGGLDLLANGGRMAVIAFHSLEDRLVKRFFARHAGRWESLQAGGRRRSGEAPRVRLVNRKPRAPSPEEMTVNPRSRSAKLRAAERTDAAE